MGCNGLKDVWIARLTEAIEKGVPLVRNLSENEASNLAGDVFSPGAHWQMLECDGEFVSEKIPLGFRAPTVPVGENSSVKSAITLKSLIGWSSVVRG